MSNEMNPLINQDLTTAPEPAPLTAAPLRPYSKKELMHLYNMPRKTMSRWLADIEPKTGKRSGRFYTIRQVQVIFEDFGAPGIRERK